MNEGMLFIVTTELLTNEKIVNGWCRTDEDWLNAWHQERHARCQETLLRHLYWACEKDIYRLSRRNAYEDQQQEFLLGKSDPRKYLCQRLQPGKPSIKIVIIEKQWLWGGGHSFDLRRTRLKTNIKAYNVTNFCPVFVIYFTMISRTQYSVTSNDRMIS